MADIFISYAREDLEKASILAEALERLGWTVFWDRSLPAGGSFDGLIPREMDDARCVLVLWSETSTRSRWVQEEADYARDRGVLVPVLVDDVQPPLGYGEILSCDLRSWHGDESANDFRRLVDGIDAKAGRALTTPAGSHFPGPESSAPAPPSRAPGSLVRTIGSGVAAIGGAFAGGVATVAESVGHGVSATAGAVARAMRDRFRRGGSEAGAPPPGSSDVRFTVRHPQTVRSDDWSTLLVYVHVPGAQDAIKKDAEARLRDSDVEHGEARSQATTAVERGAEFLVTAALPGCEFNPSRARFRWLEDWHLVELRLRASPEAPGFASESVVNGRITFFVEGVLVGEVPIWVQITEGAAAPVEPEEVSRDPYQAVFVSYAHEDSVIVDGLEKAYEALGMDYLRDVRKLRSGEAWQPALLKMIDKADAFQLCWSPSAQGSVHVEKEWRHALGRSEASFIRPVYWLEPMPDPPVELEGIEFTFVDLTH
jgi:hypothetical protein